MAFMVGGSVLREASGNVTDLLTFVANNSISQEELLSNGSAIMYNATSIVLDTSMMDNATWNNATDNDTVERSWSIYGTDFNCTKGCSYGSHNSFQVR